MKKASDVTEFSDATRALARRIETAEGSITWAELKDDFPTASSTMMLLLRKGYITRVGRGRYVATRN